MQDGIDLYYKVIKQLNPKVTEEERAYFESGFLLQQIRLKQYFIEAGKRNQLLGFVTKGLLRGYYINDAGEDITISFAKEGEWVTDYPSLLHNKPSRYYY